MPELLTSSVIFVIGLVVLVKGSDMFVESAAKIARILGVSELIIGLTLVAVGTSLPELFTGMVSSYTGNTQIVVGNVLGSNILNLTLLLGIASFFVAIPTQKDIIYRDGLTLIVYVLLFYYFAVDGSIELIEGILLLLLSFLYSVFVMESTRGVSPDSPQRSLAIMAEIIWGVIKVGRNVSLFPMKVLKSRGRLNRVNEELRRARNLREHAAKLHEFAIMAVSGVLIYFGANWFVEGAVDIADILGIGSSIVGITIVSFGTTMPELSVALQASRKRLSQMVIGNAIGSCITNTTLIIGVAAVINPLSVGKTPEIQKLIIENIIPFMVFVSILCVVLVRSRWQVTRLEGLFLILLYGGFLAWLLST
ncbi:MAG: calcium/sodium antiporter [Candidatus Altiarchaeota archaeon]|nr:calcium/sodium antiporter [Candidatus Altiarchaeota archaeon]